jgi:hypothetical protein
MFIFTTRIVIIPRCDNVSRLRDYPLSCNVIPLKNIASKQAP